MEKIMPQTLNCVNDQYFMEIYDKYVNYQYFMDIYGHFTTISPLKKNPEETVLFLLRKLIFPLGGLHTRVIKNWNYDEHHNKYLHVQPHFMTIYVEEIWKNIRNSFVLPSKNNIFSRWVQLHTSVIKTFLYYERDNKDKILW